MIVVRNIFQVKFGRMKEARELWKEGLKFVNPANQKFIPLVDSGSREMFTVVE
jgi:hypothetical protein